jgi:hypothetical protein
MPSDAAPLGRKGETDDGPLRARKSSERPKVTWGQDSAIVMVGSISPLVF